MSEGKVYKVPGTWKKRAYFNADGYHETYQQSVKNPDKFWGKHGKRIDWFKPYTKVKNTSFAGNVSIKWFEDGDTNVSYNCIDRHLKKRGDQTAIIWEGDDPYDDKKITYSELYEHVCRFANVLKKHGVKKGDRVTIYMPMIPEAAYAMLACARIGADPFGRLRRLLAGRARRPHRRLQIDFRHHRRRGPARRQADPAQGKHRHGDRIAAEQRQGREGAGRAPHRRQDRLGAGPRHLVSRRGRARVKADCPPEKMKAEDPLFILYTSGSTGKPKGVLHTTGGYLVYASMTHEYVFDYHDGDIYWCTADVGWVTGHSYIVYGPLANGATTLMFEGVPNYPDAVALLAGHRQAQGQHLLHRADRDPRADGRRRRVCEAHLARSRCACSARSASRSIPKPGNGITASSATAAARSSTPGGRPRPAAS